MTPSSRFDIAIVLIPRKAGDSIAALGEPVQALKDAPLAVAAVKCALRDLDRVPQPAKPSRSRRTL